MNILAHIGRATLAMLAEIGRVSLFLKDALLQGLTPKIFVRQILEQMLRIGYFSLPVVGLTAFFTGGALALQIYLGSSRFNAESLVASIVALGITRELGPVLAGLMVAGRVGASIAAELGTMRVTEQIDALVTLATNPFKYLVGPRIIAAVITLPLGAYGLPSGPGPYCSRNRFDGSVTSFSPSPVISNRPISCVEPKRFFTHRTIRCEWNRSPSK